MIKREEIMWIFIIIIINAYDAVRLYIFNERDYYNNSIYKRLIVLIKILKIILLLIVIKNSKGSNNIAISLLEIDAREAEIVLM